MNRLPSESRRDRNDSSLQKFPARYYNSAKCRINLFFCLSFTHLLTTTAGKLLFNWHLFLCHSDKQNEGLKHQLDASCSTALRFWRGREREREMCFEMECLIIKFSCEDEGMFLGMNDRKACEKSRLACRAVRLPWACTDVTNPAIKRSLL